MEFIYLKLKQLVTFMKSMLETYQVGYSEEYKEGLRSNLLNMEEEEKESFDFSPSACYSCGAIYSSEVEGPCHSCLEDTILKKYEDETMDEFIQTLELKKIILSENL